MSSNITAPRLAVLSALTVVLSPAVRPAVAGPLNPPSGPVSSTMRMLDEVEPRTPIASLPITISQPGSYYFTRNLTGVAGQSGITITADDVSIDLRGFCLIGVAGSLDGVRATGVRRNLDIRHGTVRAWDGDGIDGANAVNGYVTQVRAFDNGGAGIFVGVGSTVHDCVARANTGDGIVGLDGSTIAVCTATGNTGSGIRVTNGCTIVDSVGMGNTGDGIFALLGNTISSCTAKANGNDGINGNTGALITGCTAKENARDGIEILRDSYVLNNVSSGNGFSSSEGAGINVVSQDNRVDGNNVTTNPKGVHVRGPGNLVVRNSASANTVDYLIVPGNRDAQVVVNPASGFVSTDPWANFSY